MDAVSDYLFALLRSGVGSSWRWFNGLSIDEWIVVLAATFAFGMLLLRGMGKRRI